MEITFHYPPELFDLMVDTVPLLSRGKQGVLTFFRGAGVDESVLQDLAHRVLVSPRDISKYEIARTVLERLNRRGEAALRERREILKRVTEFESFASCWPEDQLKAKGLVSEIRQLVNVKDSFTRMKLEREREAQRRREEYSARVEATKKRREELNSIKVELSRLFTLMDPHVRGKKLEALLNKMFKAYGVSVRESFALCGDSSEGIVEQVDGVVEIDGHLYLVETKWWNKALGPPEVAQHLVRVFNRGHARGMFVTVSDFTPAAVHMCRESLSKATVVLCHLHEIVRLLEEEGDLLELLRKKIRAAVIDKDPYLRL